MSGCGLPRSGGRMITMSDKKSKRKLMMMKREQADSNPDGTQKLEQLVFGATSDGESEKQLDPVEASERRRDFPTIFVRQYRGRITLI
jgi:hypothetical protein